MEKQAQIYSGKGIRQLKRLSDTRWACRHAAVNALACTYEAVVATLELLTEDNDKNKAVESRGLLLQITSFSFIVSLDRLVLKVSLIYYKNQS